MIVGYCAQNNRGEYWYTQKHVQRILTQICKREEYVLTSFHTVAQESSMTSMSYHALTGLKCSKTIQIFTKRQQQVMKTSVLTMNLWRILLVFLLYGPNGHFVPFLGTKGRLQHSSFQNVFYSKTVTFLKIPSFLFLLPLYRYSQTRTIDSFLLRNPSVSPSAATDLCCSSYLTK